ncbi:MAG: hypothetical protein IKL52_07725 [Candidatus Gastranaerophilales bacterium]|nr:hypothetical protein [Candidatus Gastranaerophilales bacterium]
MINFWLKMEENFVILKYHDNFADNLSSYAYSKILEENSEVSCCYENKTNQRAKFEEKMSYFDMEYKFISSARIESLTQKANASNKYFINSKDISKKRIKRGIIDIKHFNLDDLKLLPKDIPSIFKFKNTDFIINHDILEKIQTQNSIGLYVDENDVLNNLIDIDYLQRATKRLNKYLKRPKLFIFSKTQLNLTMDLCVDYEILNIRDWREEFYFLKSCKHKIISNTNNSYSNGFWAALINEKEYYYNIYDKNLNQKTKKRNWIPV